MVCNVTRALFLADTLHIIGSPAAAAVRPMLPRSIVALIVLLGGLLGVELSVTPEPAGVPRRTRHAHVMYACPHSQQGRGARALTMIQTLHTVS